jgi:hypothetical protein
MRQQRSGIITRNAGIAPSGVAPSGRTLLTSADITYEGKYRLAQYGGTNGLDVYSAGLTHRYVGGQQRFIVTSFNGNGNDPLYYFHEFSLNGFDAFVTTRARYYNPWLFWSDNLCHKSLFWDEENQRLWSGSGFDYPQGGITDSGTPVLYSRQLPTPAPGLEYSDSNNHSGWFGFQGIGQRALWGKMQLVPDSVRTQYGFHKYMSLSGGYTSLMGQGLGPALGPMFVSFPDLLSNYTPRSSYTDAYNVPSTDFQICGDTRGGVVSTDWYDGYAYSARPFDRGVRSTGVENYFDGGDPRSNPTTRPTDPPDVAGHWLSQPTIASVPGDPDGWNRWTWGDTYGGSGCWIDNQAGTRTKQGIAMVANLGAGKTWYMTSALHKDSSAIEIHIYDPADLAAVKNGAMDAWKIRPKSIKVITGDMIAPKFLTVDATFDPVTSKLYIAVFNEENGSGIFTTIYQYAVAT